MGIFARVFFGEDRAPSPSASALTDALTEFGRYSITRNGTTDLHAVVKLLSANVRFAEDALFGGSATTGGGLYQLDESSPDRLYQILRAAVESVGGWAAVGAMCLGYFVVNDGIYGTTRQPRNADFEVVMELATTFLRDRHIPQLLAISPAQGIWFDLTHPNTEWIEQRPVPDLSIIVVPELERGEERVIALFGLMQTFRLIALAQPDGGFAAYREDPEDGGGWARWGPVAVGDDLPHLYRAVANWVPFTPKWWVPELEVLYRFPTPDFH